MKTLINLANVGGQACISSELIAENTGTAARSMSRLINSHKQRLESFGVVRFQITPKTKKTVYFLNEDQAIFVLTLSKNSEIVVNFKHKLVTEFSKLRRKQAIIDERHAKVGWQQSREVGKLTRRQETDTIKDFLVYAGLQGSSNYPAHGYALITKMVDSALNLRGKNDLSEDSLAIVSVGEQVAERALKAGMDEQLEYKEIFKLAKAEVSRFAEMVNHK